MVIPAKGVEAWGGALSDHANYDAALSAPQPHHGPSSSQHDSHDLHLADVASAAAILEPPVAPASVVARTAHVHPTIDTAQGGALGHATDLPTRLQPSERRPDELVGHAARTERPPGQ